MKISRAKKGSITILLFAITLVASFTVPYIYLIHMKEKKINDTTTICREVMELVNAVNDHYLSFIRAAGAYIDEVEQQVRDIKLEYEGGRITRSQMLSSMSALSTNFEHEIYIKSLWQASGSTLAMPVGSEASSTFITRMGLTEKVNGDMGNSETVESVTMHSYIESWVTSPLVLSHIPQVWLVEITVTPKGKLDLGTMRKYLLGKIINSSTQENECVKVNILTADENSISVKIEYSIRGILDDSMSVTGM